MSADLVGNGGLAQPHSPGTAQQRGPDLCFRCLSPAEDSEACEAVITTLSEVRLPRLLHSIWAVYALLKAAG